MSFPQTASDLDELTERAPYREPLDPLSELFQSAGFSGGHVFNETIEPVKGLRTHIRVSRFYWTPRITVDFEREAGSLDERDLKRVTLATMGIRHIVIRDAFDTQAARLQLQPQQQRSLGSAPVAGKPRASRSRAPRGKARAAS